MHQVLFNTHDLVLLFTIGFSLLALICYCLQPSFTREAKIFAAVFFISSAAIAMDTLVNFGAAFHGFVLRQAPHIIYAFEFGSWLQAPVAYWFIRSQVDADFKFSRSDLWLLLPFFLASCHQIIAYHSLSAAEKIALQSSRDLLGSSITIFLVQTAREVFRCVLAVWSVHWVVRYFALQPSNPWLWWHSLGQCVLNGLGLIIAILLTCQVFYQVSLPIGEIGLSQNYLAVLYLAGLLVLTHYSACRNSWPIPQRLNKHQGRTQATINPVYVHALEPLMQEEKVYTDPELSLERLAQRIGVSPRTLSAVINGHYGCSFFEYINRYRLEEAKRLLAASQHTVLDVMYEAGFSSKATFNGLFKRCEGITPSQYRRSRQSSYPLQ